MLFSALLSLPLVASLEKHQLAHTRNQETTPSIALCSLVSTLFHIHDTDY